MALTLPSATPFVLPASSDASTVAELKARASAVCGVPSTHLLIFAASPLADGASVEPYQTLFLAVGAQSTPTAAPSGVSNLDAAVQPPILGMYADHRMLIERVRRMKTGLALGEEGTEAAELQLRGASSAARNVAASLTPRVEVAELQQTLRATERRANEAERRVKELERQLAEAQRSLSKRQGTATPTTHMAQPEAATTPPPSDKPAALPAPTAVVREPQRPTPSGDDGKDLIASIRREKASDLTVDVPPELTVAVEALRGALHRSLALLSEDLYRDDVHAVSELLQNADDNAYAPGADPAWALHCSSGNGAGDGAPACAWTTNNELGMTERDVRALCDAGNSSKRGVAGRIGRKGVGFKSCFKLSASPHVLSAGFAFRFDLAANGLLGYILPERIDAVTLAAMPEAARRAWQDGKKTVVYLPLRADAPDARAMCVALRQRASSLFFLRQLRRLTWVDEATGDELSFERGRLDDDANPAALTTTTPAPTEAAPAVAAPAAAAAPEGVEAWHATVEELRCAQREGGVHAASAWRFLRCAATLRVPSRLRAEAAAETTEVVLVLPLRGGTAAEAAGGAAGGEAADAEAAAAAFARHVHCFLPVRDVGLRFALHADFSLTSSRDDVHDCAWNRWLRDAIPPLLVAAVAAQPTGSKGASTTPSPALAFLPAGGARLAEPFWQPLVDGAVRELRASRLPVLCSEGGELCALGALRLRPPCVPRELVSNETLKECLGGVQFASAGGAGVETLAADEETLRAIGVRPFGLADLATCVHVLEAKRVGPPPMRWLTELYAAVYELCRSHSGGLQEASQLARALPILPLRAAPSRAAAAAAASEPRRSLAAAVDGPVFTTLPAVAWAGAAELEGTLPRLRLLSSEMVEQLTTAEAGARRLLQALDVRAATPTDLLDHLLREHEAAAVCGGLPTSSVQARKQRLLDQLRLVRRLHEADGGLTESQKPLVMVPTCGGGVKAAADVALEKLLGGIIVSEDADVGDEDGDSLSSVFCGDAGERCATPTEDGTRVLDALRDERFLVEVLGARQRPLHGQTCRLACGDGPPDYGEACLAALLAAVADPRLRSYVQSLLQRFPFVGELRVWERLDGRHPGPESLDSEHYKGIADCFFEPAFAHFNSGLPCINPPLPQEPEARKAVLDALRTIGVQVDVTVASCLTAINRLHVEGVHDDDDPPSQARMLRRQLPLLCWLATHLQLASGQERAAAIASIGELTQTEGHRQHITLFADMHGDQSHVVLCDTRSACWFEGTEASQIALMLGVPNLAHGYRSASSLFASDVLNPRRHFTEDELCRALDLLSDALMDNELPEGDSDHVEEARAVTSLALTGPVEQLHAVATHVYTCLAEKGSDVLRVLDADFYADKRRIFVPAAAAAAAAAALAVDAAQVALRQASCALGHHACRRLGRRRACQRVHRLEQPRRRRLGARWHVERREEGSKRRRVVRAQRVQPARRCEQLLVAARGEPVDVLRRREAGPLVGGRVHQAALGVGGGGGGGGGGGRSDVCPRHGPGCTHPACHALS